MLLKKQHICIIVSLLCFLCSCKQAHSGVQARPLPIAIDTISYKELGQLRGGCLTVRDTIDFDNRRCNLPDGITLNFKGGILKNGTLVGSNTRLKSKEVCLDRVRILGSWNVPVITTALFRDLSYDNALKDVVALSDSTIKNKIIIEPGDYIMTAYKNGDICIPINGNTDFILKGTIRLTPNDYRNYYIVQAQGKHITIRGNGTITGDKHTHTGDSGEWGMGINLDHAHHVLIKGLTVKDCWGDCIYVGSESTDVRIEKCMLDHGRRQGISITSADGVIIKDCTITNVGGTAPEYAIDVEPNKGETVENVVIQNVFAKDCKGGFLVYGKAPNARIGKVTIQSSRVEYNTKLAISVLKCDIFKMEKCQIRQKSVQRVMNFEDIDDVIVRNNTYHNEQGSSFSLVNKGKSLLKANKEYNPITITRCKNTHFVNNCEN